MRGYGQHPTNLDALPNEELISMYRREVWIFLSEDKRQELLQETVNRSALAKGEIGACKVVFEDLGHNTFGAQSENLIKLNKDFFVHDKMVYNNNGYYIEELFKDSNIKALETVLHEDIHAWQNQVIKGEIIIPDEQLRKEYVSNNFSTQVIIDQYGNYQLGSTYLNGAMDKYGYYFYYFQSTERDAHKVSEEQTKYVINYLSENYGDEQSFEIYLNGLKVNGYEATLQKAADITQLNDFPQQINTIIMNHYYGTAEDVNLTLNRLVEEEMVLSYCEQNKSYSNHVEETNENNESITVSQNLDETLSLILGNDESVETKGEFIETNYDIGIEM